MKEFLRTNDAVEISWTSALPADAGIETVVLDSHAGIVEGSIAAIQRRIMAAGDKLEGAHRYRGPLTSTRFPGPPAPSPASSSPLRCAHVGRGAGAPGTRSRYRRYR